MFFEKAKQIKLNVLLQTLSQKGTTKTKSVQKVKINNRFKVRTGYRKSYSLFFLFNQFI